VTFALDRLQKMAPDHPEWKDNPVLQAALKSDMKAVAASGMKGVVEIVMVTHAGMTIDQFAGIVSDWIRSAEHPKLKKKYTELTYQPMKELLAYLRANGFKTYIVSGGGIEFMRPWAEAAYGVPPEQVIGSSIVTEFKLQNGKPVLVRQPKVFFIDDKEGKAVGSACLSTTRTQHGSSPMIARASSASSTRALTTRRLAPDRHENRLGPRVLAVANERESESTPPVCGLTVIQKPHPIVEHRV
jgi:hypothetical protein